MQTLWSERALPFGRGLTGTCAFRLLPTDDFASGPASGECAAYAKGFALTVTYTWTHPVDGEQEGVLLVASPVEDDDGALSATWVDSWHQKPGPLHLTGTVDDDALRLRGTYYEVWGWEIDIELTDAAAFRLIMRNVVPAEAVSSAPEGMDVQAGPYDVMDLRLT